LQLSSDSHGELVDKPDVFRDLEMRDLVLAEPAYFVLARGFTAVQLNPRGNLFAESSVSYAER